MIKRKSKKDKAKLNVLLVSPYNPCKSGGIGTWTKTLLDYNYIDGRANIYFQNTSTKLPKTWAQKNKLTHLLIGAIDSLKILVVLLYNLLTKNPDVIHYTSSGAMALYKDIVAIFIAKKLFKRKFIIHWHFGRIPLIFELKGKEYELFCKVCDRVDCSIVIDGLSYNILLEHKIKSKYIPNPIPEVLQSEAEKLDLCNIWNLRTRGTVLFVGHILKTKGVYELVRACIELEEVTNLILVGPFFDDKIKDDLVSLAQQRNSGKWLQIVGEQKREDVWAYYKKCNVFCLPSYTEGFPFTILESMSFGCPIIATSVGAIPELLDDGCGVVIEKEQVLPLKKSIREMINNPDSSYSMGSNAHVKALKTYTINELYEMYYETWTEVNSNK